MTLIGGLLAAFEKPRNIRCITLFSYKLPMGQSGSMFFERMLYFISLSAIFYALDMKLFTGGLFSSFWDGGGSIMRGCVFFSTLDTISCFSVLIKLFSPQDPLELMYSTNQACLVITNQDSTLLWKTDSTLTMCTWVARGIVFHMGGTHVLQSYSFRAVNRFFLTVWVPESEDAPLLTPAAGQLGIMRGRTICNK